MTGGIVQTAEDHSQPESLWRHVSPLTLKFRDCERESQYESRFHESRLQTDAIWRVLSLGVVLPLIPRLRYENFQASAVTALFLLRAAPSLLPLPLPRPVYRRVRQRVLLFIRVVRVGTIAYSVYGLGGQFKAQEWYPLAVESLVSCMMLPIGYQMLFKHHLLWDTIFSACVIAFVCTPGGLCSQAVHCLAGEEGAPVFEPVFGALASFVHNLFHALLFSEAPRWDVVTKLPPPPRCALAALALLLLGGVLLRSAVLYCLELHSRSLELRAQGLHVARGNTLVAYFASQHAVLLLAGVAAFFTAVSRLI